ncbi:MAG: BspA family leucine-rich repeat surface protein [Paludibacteraceae bacterium]|nr:BspA family leucine-rich repeat surface protein [Paludibacteraceae bacterium]
MKNAIRFLVLLALMAAQTLKADNEIYGFFSEDGKTFTLNFDENKTKNSGLTPDEWIGYEYQSNRTKVEKVVFDKSMDKARPTTTFSWFGGFSKLTTIEHIDYLHTDEVTTMTDMFWNCRRLTSLDIHHFCMEKVTNVNGMFADCATLTTICCDDDWSKSSITESKNLFAGCKVLIGGNGTVFSSAHITLEYARPDEGTENPGYFTLPEIYGVFDGEKSTFDIYYDGNKTAQAGVSPEEWRDDAYASMRENVETIIYDYSMNDARLTATAHWYEGFTKLKHIYNFSFLNTSEVTDMSYMFANCESINNVYVINTRNVTSMKGMFMNCKSLIELQTVDFDMNKVTDASEMFSGCTSLERIYCNDDWSVLGFNGEDMFKGCTALKGTCNGHTTFFDEEHTGKEYARTDGGTDRPGYFTEINYVYGVFSKDGNTFTLYCDTKIKEREGITDWKTNEYASSRAEVKKVVVDESMRYHSLSSTYGWFRSFSNMTTIEHIEYLNTYRTKDMRQMFKDCLSLEVLDLRGFLMDYLLYSDEMFMGCTSLKTIYCSYNLSVYPNLLGTDMFAGCTSLIGGNDTKYDASFTNKSYAKPDEVSNPGYFTIVNELYGYLYNETFYITYDGKRHRSWLSFYPDGHIEPEGKLPEEWMADTYAERRATAKSINFFTYKLENVHPTSTAHWFEGFTEANEVFHIQWLQTDEVTDMSYMFAGCTKLDTLQGFEYLKTGKVQSMKGMFLNCQSVKELDVRNFDMSNVKDAGSMFAGCKNLEAIACENDWSAFSFDDTDMFEGCTSLQGGANPPTLYSAEHTGKEYARFDGGSALPGYFSGDKEIYGVFSADGKTYTLYYDRKKAERGGFAPSDDENTRNMRYDVEKAVIDITMKDALPNDMSGWFWGFSKMTRIENLGYLNTSKVGAMNMTFYHCKSLTTIDLRTFDLRKLEYMNFTFAYCSNATNIYMPTRYRLENLRSMRQAFMNCVKLTELDLHAFSLKKKVDLQYPFTKTNNLTVIYCDEDWSLNKSIENGDGVFSDAYALTGSQGTKYEEGKWGIEYAHPDGGTENPGYFTPFLGEFYGIYSSTGDTLTLYYDKKKIEREGCDWTLSIYKDLNGNVKTVIFDESVKEARLTTLNLLFSRFTHLTAIEHLDYLNTSEVTDMSYMFSECENLASLDVRNFDISKVTNMDWMFAGCTSLKTIYCNKDWSKNESVKSSAMFFLCVAIEGGAGTAYDNDHQRIEYARPDQGTSAPGYFTALFTVTFLDKDNNVLSVMEVSGGETAVAPEAPEVEGFVFIGWDKELTNVTENMVVQAQYVDISKIEPEVYVTVNGTILNVWYDKQRITRKTTTCDLDEFTSDMRNTTKKVVIDPSVANTTIASMYNQFANMPNLESVEGLEYIHTADVSFMFMNCTALKSIDLNGFDLSGVTSAVGMFMKCTNLTTIYCEADYTSLAGAVSIGMFDGCTALVGGNGTTYNPAHKDASYARPDEGSSAPGYFTSKKTPTGIDNILPDTDNLHPNMPAGHSDTPAAQKLLRNGILYILRNGKTYNANGQLLFGN